MSYLLSKSKLQSYQQCAKKFWLEINQPGLAKTDDAQQLVLDRGTKFGTAVRSCFVGGKLIEETHSLKAVQETRELLDTFVSVAKRTPIFEAAFTYKGVLVRVDVMNPLRDGTWEFIEVKSGTIKFGEDVKAHHLRDAAIQYFVAEHSGAPIEISKVNLGVPLGEFVLAERANLTNILNRVDVTTRAKNLFTDIETSILSASLVSQQTQEPTLPIGVQCRAPHKCGFATYCTGAELKTGESICVPVWHLSKDPLTEIVQKFLPKTRNLALVEDADLKRPIHLKMKRVAGGQAYFLDPQLHTFLFDQSFPRYFLDYETNNSPLPLWIGTRPGEVIPFQFSIHKWAAPNATLQHFEFIADTTDDPRASLAEELLSVIHEPGSVFAWNGRGTEGPITEKLCQHYPAGAVELRRIADSCRFNDPLRRFRDWFYFPQMAGNWGLKSIAKSILPTNPYDKLKIRNGVEAMRSYERFLDTPPSTTRDALKEDLLEYCKVDTLVMIDIWRVVSKLATNP